MFTHRSGLTLAIGQIVAVRSALHRRRQRSLGLQIDGGALKSISFVLWTLGTSDGADRVIADHSRRRGLPTHEARLVMRDDRCAKVGLGA